MPVWFVPPLLCFFLFFFLKSGLLLCFCGTAGGLLNMCGCDGACWIGMARTVGNSHSLLLFHSPASISRTEACKDMHAFSSVRVLRKRRVFINQSGEKKEPSTPSLGGVSLQISNNRTV